MIYLIQKEKAGGKMQRFAMDDLLKWKEKACNYGSTPGWKDLAYERVRKEVL